MFLSFSSVTTAALPFLQYFHLSNIIFFLGLQGFYISRNLMHTTTSALCDSSSPRHSSKHFSKYAYWHFVELESSGYFRGCYLVIALFWHNYLAFVEHFFSVRMVYFPVWFVYCFCIFTELKYCSNTSLVSPSLLHLLLSWRYMHSANSQFRNLIWCFRTSFFPQIFILFFLHDRWNKHTICYWVQCCGRPCKCYSSWSPSFDIDGLPEHYNQGEEKRLWTTSLYFSPTSLQPIFFIWKWLVTHFIEYQS